MPTQLNSWNPDKLEPAIYPQFALTIAAKLGASQTLAKGTVLGQRTSDGLLYEYDDQATDGTETAVAILQYDVATDAGGNHYFGDSAVPNPSNLPNADVPVYIAGYFDPNELDGIDANGLDDLGAKTLPNGLIRIP